MLREARNIVLALLMRSPIPVIINTKPERVAFANRLASQTTVVFSEAGEYELIVEVSDGDKTDQDSIYVTVRASHSGEGEKELFINSIDFKLIKAIHIPCEGTLQIYNLSGKVKELNCTDIIEGKSHATWRGRNLSGDVVASGIYLVQEKDGTVHKVSVLK